MHLDLGEHALLHHPNHFNLWPDYYYFNYYYYCQCYMEGEKDPIQECGELLMHDCN